MNEAALQIIAAIASNNQLKVLTDALKALESLAEDDGTIELFDFQCTSEQSGNFQIGAVQRADNGALSMALGAFYFRSTDNRRRFLFFSWGSRSINFWAGAQKMSLNEEVYSGVREIVEKKVADTAANYIAALNIN